MIRSRSLVVVFVVVLIEKMHYVGVFQGLRKQMTVIIMLCVLCYID